MTVTVRKRHITVRWRVRVRWVGIADGSHIAGYRLDVSCGDRSVIHWTLLDHRPILNYGLLLNHWTILDNRLLLLNHRTILGSGMLLKYRAILDHRMLLNNRTALSVATVNSVVAIDCAYHSEHNRNKKLKISKQTFP